MRYFTVRPTMTKLTWFGEIDEWERGLLAWFVCHIYWCLWLFQSRGQGMDVCIAIAIAIVAIAAIASSAVLKRDRTLKDLLQRESILETRRRGDQETSKVSSAQSNQKVPPPYLVLPISSEYISPCSNVEALHWCCTKAPDRSLFIGSGGSSKDI